MTSSDVCEHQNTNYLRMMSERDALRDVVRELDAVMHHHADRADAAEAEVERLRAGVERIRDALTAHIVEYGPMIDAEAPEADLTRLLAGSGERPGEVDGYCTCHGDQRGRTRDCGVKAHREAGRPAPVGPDSDNVHEPGDDEHTPGANVTQPAIPDSTDVWERVRQALRESRRTGLGGMTEAQALDHMTDAVLAAAGPLIERAVGERVAGEIERLRDALTDDPDRAALELLIEDAASLARGEGS